MNLRLAGLALFSVSIGVLFAVPRWSASAHSVEDKKFSPSIPRTWDDKAMAELEVPLADASASPKQVPADFYYQIPVRAIYKDYPVYAPGHEPPGYFDWLKNQEPVILWDDKGHAPPLATEADWIKPARSSSTRPLVKVGFLLLSQVGRCTSGIPTSMTRQRCRWPLMARCLSTGTWSEKRARLLSGYSGAPCVTPTSCPTAQF